MGRLLIAIACFSAYAAWAQVAPEAEWEGLEPRAAPDAGTAPSEPPPPPVNLGAPLSDAPLPVPVWTPPSTRKAVGPPQDPNRVTAFGALALGQWKRAQTVYLGFPFLGLRLGLGVTDRVDVFVGLDSFWGMMNEPRAAVRWNVWQGSNWAFAAALEGGVAFFNTKPAADVRGARWLSGRRNYNLVPGAVLSYQGDHARATRVIFDVRYQAAFDTEPFQKDPLGGVPASVSVGHNALFRVGVELPLGPRSAVAIAFNIDAHMRPEDAVLMPGLVVGVVTSL